MVDITHKVNSLRQAIATATVNVSNQATIDAIVEKKVPKGDIFEFSRAAGLFAIKKTSDVIPDCHPLPVEYAAISFKIEEFRIIISVEVHTIYKTGVEVEAMHGAAITALTIYDMLKPIDKSVEISTIRLQSKKGGKTDHADQQGSDIRTAVVVCSDSISEGKSEDRSGKTIMERLLKFEILVSDYEIIPDDLSTIREKAKQLSESDFDLVIFSGGTGLSPRDNTPEAITTLLDRQIPGIMEAARNYGQQRTPYAMLSRGVAGFIKQTLVITLPGSVKAAEENMEALFPYVLHVFKVAKGLRH